jgi:hypothetical protein
MYREVVRFEEMLALMRRLNFESIVLFSES